MKRPMVIAGVLGLSLLATAAFPGDSCNAPMASWQPREAVAEKARAMGWVVERIRTDDGCYKVYARDAQGRRVKVEFDPATLEVLEIETRDNDEHGTTQHDAHKVEGAHEGESH